ncbi:hypothetical protein LXL04_035169 [Taraxacum kok-saghyz]
MRKKVEWDSFIRCLRKPLPAAFRINSSFGIRIISYILLYHLSYGPLKSLLGSDDVKLLQHVDLKCVGWHQKKDLLAFISARNQVTIRDYGDSEGKDPCILMNDLQREAKLLE